MSWDKGHLKWTQNVNSIYRDAQIYLSQRIFEAIAVTCCHFKLCVTDATCTTSVQKKKIKLSGRNETMSIRK